jgi:hypothetical protein
VAESPPPIYIQRSLLFGGTATHLICGMFMLRGRNWARILFVSWSVLSLPAAAVATSYKLFMIPGAIILAIEAFFLFRPAANAFFADNGANIDPACLPTNRRVAGLIFYLFAGFVLTTMGMLALMPSASSGVKTLLLVSFLLPFSVCLAIGKWLAAGNWKLDVGLVFVIGSLGGIALAAMMAFMFSQPEILQKLPPKQVERMQDLLTDYTFATVWFGAWLLLGIALISLGRRPPKAAQFPPIFGR